MMITSSPNDRLVIQSNHWSTIWFFYDSSSDIVQDASPSQSIWITTFMVFIPISYRSSSTGTPGVLITDIDIYGSLDTCMLPILTWLVGLPKNFNGGRFPTVIGFSESVLYFVNSTTGWWYIKFIMSVGFSYKDTSVDEFPHHFTYINLWPCCIVLEYVGINSS